MAKFAYPEIWKKSFLLEIVIPGGEPSEIFTFSLPPENIEVVYPQRVSETKTFGGLFVDDYGHEAAKITLSGTTGNSESRRIYRSARGDLWMTGKDEIYYIRDHIIRYKEGRDNFGDAKLYLYNLSSITDEEISRGNYKAATDSWEVVLKDFRVTQSKERPFWYSYTVEFTGLRILGKEKTTSATKKETDSLSLIEDADSSVAPLEDPEEVMMVGSGLVSSDSMAGMHDVADEYVLASYHPGQPVEERLRLASADGILSNTALSQLERAGGGSATTQLANAATARAKSRSILQGAGLFLQNAYSWSTKVANPVRNLRRSIARLQSGMQYYRSLISGTINNTLFSIPLQAIGLTRDVTELGFGIISAPADIANDVLSGFRSVRRGVESVFADFETGIIPDFVKAKYTQVVETFQAEVEACIHIAEDDICAVAADSRLPSAMPDVLVIPAETADAVPRVVLAYGYNYVQAAAGVSLETLASRYLGDPDDAILIALANGIADESEIQPGDVLRIPASRSMSVPGNEVYSREDNHGVDIALSNSGQIVIDASGELSTVSGDENISQAIRSRLGESIGNRIRLTVYGIRANTGQPVSAAASYVATSIRDTVIHDPRIQRLENFVFRGVGDRLYVEFDYITVDGNRNSYQGVH
ncbi:MAG: hypothetical protein SAMD01599839_07750 [Rectinema sp.]